MIERHLPPFGTTATEGGACCLVLLIASLAGMVGALESGLKLGNPVLIDTALTLGIAAAILTGVACTQRSRLQPLKAALEEVVPEAAPEGIRTRAIAQLQDLRARLHGKLEEVGYIQASTAAAAVTAICFVLGLDLNPPTPGPDLVLHPTNAGGCRNTGIRQVSYIASGVGS
jgi:hypothetical protein